MGSLMADLENNLASLNKWMEKHNKPLVTQDELMIALFDEVQTIWPMMGYPPLVTPFSQYVKNAALVNVMQMMKGKERWSLLDDNTWDMLLGKSGRLPGEVSDELKKLAAEQGREFFEGDPQDLQPDALDEFRAKMKEQGWDTGQDDEELFEYAMHPQQYENYKSGKAKEAFEKDLAERKKPAETPTAVSVDAPMTFAPKSLNVNVNGELFKVTVSYDGASESSTAPIQQEAPSQAPVAMNGAATKEILAPLEGKIYMTKDSTEKALKIGDKVSKGDIVCYIEAMKVTNAVKSDVDGQVVDILIKDGDDVLDDDVLIKLA